MDKAFVGNTIASLGEKNASTLLSAIENGEPVVSVRRNGLKLSIDNFRDHFKGNVDGVVLWCKDGIYLKDRPVFALDPLFHAGAYYVQEASSMSVASIPLFTADYEAHLRILDLCAAPGGKTTAIAGSISGESLLVANEVIRNRATVLAENVTKWGRANVMVTNCQPADFKKVPGFFDIILADVPCSGEGMFRKDSEAMEQWSPANVALCAARQRKIIADAWSALRPGGYLIYSTCTYNHFENDDNVEWIASELGAQTCEIPFQGPVRTRFGYQFIPGVTRGEGFFFAVLKKNGDAEHSPVRTNRLKPLKCPFVKQGFFSLEKDSLVKTYPSSLVDEMLFLEHSLRAIRSGVATASVKGKDMVPEASLAISEAINDDCFFNLDLSLEDALKFLRLEPLTFSAVVPKGFLLLKYSGVNVGFVKNLGNRSNNLYPTAWRLRI
ncbi:MAG: rRNA cytosine-C5-methyltransferase [Bacteroidales bacterium]|nr:rRNA cytosine-C5-methyltransferase [Bacteroidales bacterium]